MIPAGLRQVMLRQQYRLAGSHSAVKVCNWTKRALRGKGSCYKQRFYGIQSHRCLQMTPWLDCPNMCLYCWRMVEHVMLREPKSQAIDEPGAIIDSCVESQRKLLSGFKGFADVDIAKWREAQEPNQAAISLAGEPTLYPRISDLIGEFKRRGFTAFLVTNGQFPERLRNMEEPTNLHISLDAPDEETYKKTDRPTLPGFWKRMNESLGLMPSFSCTKVIRLTMVKGLNMANPRGYAKLIGLASPDFIEVKGYMFVGFSRRRLRRENMPSHLEVRDFASRVAELSGYQYKDEHEESRVVLLSKRCP
ncbi:MAG: 4-demethylwyosine synthase TYW1 [Candidatus Aenigmarchaeota archaeon]|nr:4-demethylwyosine synthase TYW1 [Candidatus Aenigmarchaeota archaeon]